MISEIGSGVKSYPFYKSNKEVRNGRSQVFYRFRSNKTKEQYIVAVTENGLLKKARVDFGTLENKDQGHDRATNLGEPYRILSTVVEIVRAWAKEDVHWPERINRFVISAAQKDSETLGPGQRSQRMKMYLEYIKNQFPESRIRFKSGDAIVTDIEKYITKENLSQIKESAKSDRKQRKNAKRIVDALLRATKNITRWREFGYVSEDGRFFLYPWKLDGFHRRDFIFAFSASKRSGYGEIDYREGKKKHLIQIYALRAKGDLSGLSKTLQKRRSTLTHEVIHALDRSRNKSDTESWARPEHGYEAYFSSPTEFNAYYQEAIAKYERRLEGLSQEERRKFSNLKERDFRDFKEFFYNHILNKGFRKYANKKYHKKMKKRLYKYYTKERKLREIVRRVLKEDRIENLEPSPIDHIKKSQMLKRTSQRNIEKYNFYDFNLVDREKGYYEINLRSKIVNAKVERPEQNMLTFSFRSTGAMRRARHMAAEDGPLAVAKTIIKILDHYAGAREIKRYINAFCVLSNAAPRGLDANTLKNAFRQLVKQKPGRAMETNRGEIVLTF